MSNRGCYYLVESTFGLLSLLSHSISNVLNLQHVLATAILVRTSLCHVIELELDEFKAPRPIAEVRVATLSPNEIAKAFVLVDLTLQHLRRLEADVFERSHFDGLVSDIPLAVCPLVQLELVIVQQAVHSSHGLRLDVLQPGVGVLLVAVVSEVDLHI